MIGVLVIHVPLRSESIEIAQSHTIFLEEDFEKRISNSHILKEN